MEELLKALAPWPMLQGIAFGMIVAAAGIWAMRRGMQDSRRGDTSQTVRIHLSDEEIRLQWDTHKNIEHIHENSFALVKHMEKLVELQLMTIAALNRIADARWNKIQ